MLCKFQVYSIMIHNVKHYTPFIVMINIGHIPYAVQIIL